MNNRFGKEVWDIVKPGIKTAVTLLIIGGVAYIGVQIFDISIEDMLALAGRGSE